MGSAAGRKEGLRISLFARQALEMLVAKLEKLSQLKRQLQKEQRVMDDMELQRSLPTGTALFNKKRLAEAISGQNEVRHPIFSLHQFLTHFPLAAAEDRLRRYSKSAPESKRHQEKNGTKQLRGERAVDGASEAAHRCAAGGKGRRAAGTGEEHELLTRKTD